MRSIRSRLFALLLSSSALLLPLTEAQAVPSFARQTGMDCTTCHMSWLELTNVGRRFKLGGYQLMKTMADDAKRPLVTFKFDDDPPLIPIALMAQISNTSTKNVNTPGADPSGDFPKNNQVVLQQFSVFLNGKLADHVGCFCQWTYDDVARHSSIDNAEVRIADEYESDKFNALYGLSINNSPTMSDIYNTTPVWGWPYAGSTVAPAPAASTMINGGLAQQVVGFTGYGLINRTFYVEGGGYRTADGVFSLFRAGIPHEDRGVLSGTAPYYRLALQQDWDKGHQSGMIGTFGLDSKKYPDNLNPTGPTDRFRDYGFDAQYQYITDRHRFSAMFTYIREKQTLDGTYALGGSSNVNNTLEQINTKVSYYFNKWYGISAGYQKTTGSNDDLLYNTGSPVTGSVNASPNSTAQIVELNYLFSFTGEDTFRRNRLVLQYMHYTKFNGASSNYDGFGRNAKDNNTLYLLGWFLF
jgi:hypothetical protein